MLRGSIGDGRIGVQVVNESIVRVYFPTDGNPNIEELVLNLSACGDPIRFPLVEGNYVEVHRSAEGVCTVGSAKLMPPSGTIGVQWTAVNDLTQGFP